MGIPVQICALRATHSVACVAVIAIVPCPGVRTRLSYTGMARNLLAAFRHKPASAIEVDGDRVDRSLLCEVLDVAVQAACAIDGDVVHVVCGAEVYDCMHQLVLGNARVGEWEPLRYYHQGMPVGLGIPCGRGSVVYVSAGMLSDTVARRPSRIIIPYMSLVTGARYKRRIINAGLGCTVFGLFHTKRQHLLPNELLRFWVALFGERRVPVHVPTVAAALARV